MNDKIVTRNKYFLSVCMTCVYIFLALLRRIIVVKMENKFFPKIVSYNFLKQYNKVHNFTMTNSIIKLHIELSNI